MSGCLVVRVAANQEQDDGVPPAVYECNHFSCRWEPAAFTRSNNINLMGKKAGMAITKDQIKDLYKRRAGNYNFSANLYYLLGFREAGYRKLALSKLQLDKGDTAVEIGCGTGLNFKYVLDYIGQTGRIIGVDLSDAMLAKARARISRNGWRNIKLLQMDAAEYTFPPNIKAVYSTFALTMVPEYAQIIEKAADALPTEGRLMILDLKRPQHRPLWLIKLAVLITKPFGVTLDLVERKPWEVMKRYFTTVNIQELYGGFAYIAVGRKEERKL